MNTHRLMPGQPNRDLYSPAPRRLLDGRVPTCRIKICAMALKIDKLSDHFGQYGIFLRCSCGHWRECYPNTLAAIAGWDARLADVAKRMRCSKCGRKDCVATVVEMQKPRGYRS